jgi:hypothetical protein
MWLSPKVFSILEVSKDSVDALREELAAIKVERDLLKAQLATSQIHFDWILGQVNTLQMERTALLDKAYGVKIATPEIVRRPVKDGDINLNELDFSDIGDQLAGKYGFPAYTDK